MKKVQNLQDFGNVLHRVRTEMCYTTDLLAFDMKASKRVYGGV